MVVTKPMEQVLVKNMEGLDLASGHGPYMAAEVSKWTGTGIAIVESSEFPPLYSEYYLGFTAWNDDISVCLDSPYQCPFDTEDSPSDQWNRYQVKLPIGTQKVGIFNHVMFVGATKMSIIEVI